MVGATSIDARKYALQVVIDSAANAATDTRARFLDVSTEDIEIIGERNGFTYGQWKGGPAGALNIEFYWQFAKDIPSEVRAQFERAAKVWGSQNSGRFSHVHDKGRQNHPHFGPRDLEERAQE